MSKLRNTRLCNPIVAVDLAEACVRLAGGLRAVCTVFLLCTAAAVTPSTAQTFRKIADFTVANGAGPYSALVQGTDGNFYGTTTYGASNFLGVVFILTPNSTLTALHSFAGPPADGAYPVGGLLQSTDGSFYGTTPGGGANHNCLHN